MLLIYCSQSFYRSLLIDDVREVVTFDDRDLEGSSPFISKEASFISGIAKKEDELIAILDIATLLG